jgi:hypothetical protein
MLFREFIKHTFQFLVKAILHIFNFVLSRSRDIQNNKMKPVSFQYYVLYPITNMLNPLTC